MYLKRRIDVQKSQLFSIYLIFVLRTCSLNSVYSSSISTCYCTHVEKCAYYKSLPLKVEPPLNAEKLRGQALEGTNCGFKGYPSLVCCPIIKSTSLVTHNTRKKRNPPFRRISSDYPVVWDRRPFIPVIEDIDESELPVANRFASIRDNYPNKNPYFFATNVLDFKDAKSFRNSPQPFYEENNDASRTKHHHYEYHVGHDDHTFSPHNHRNTFDAPIVYPDDKRLNRPFVYPGPFGTHFDVIAEKTFRSRQDRAKPKSAGLTTTSLNAPQCGISPGASASSVASNSPSQFPWVARIAYLNKTSNRISYRCSGSVIRDTYILTAAHCVINLVKDLQLSHVRIGDDMAAVKCLDNTSDCETSRTYTILDVIVHQDYDQPKYANDIALLRISRPRADNYATICLPLNSSANIVDKLIGSTGVVAGWSTNKEGVETPANATVKFLRLPIVNNTECAIIYAEYTENFNDPIVITPSQLCAQGQPMNDICKGDSGGPFMDDGTSGLINSNGRYTLLGIVAFGPTMCGVSNFPGVYTRVSSFVHWIATNIS